MLKRVSPYLSVLVLGCSLLGCRTFGRGDPTTDYEQSTGGHVRPVSYEEPVEEPLKLSDFSPKSINAKFKGMVGWGPDKQLGRQYFDEAETLYSQASQASGQGRLDLFADAAEKYNDALGRWPDGEWNEEALFKEGESWFFADQYPRSAKAFDVLVKKYPNSDYLDVVDRRRFAIANYWLESYTKDPHWALTPNVTDRKLPRNDTFGNAVKVLDNIRLQNPTGDIADDATLRAANAFFVLEKYYRADQLFEDLRASFPSSEHQFQAHYLAVITKLKLYSGPDYAGQPLDDAEKLVKKLYRTFPREAESRHEHLSKALADIRSKQAERELHMAKYYERRHEYGAARFYYDRILQKYPGTNLSKSTQKRLNEIADKPPTPPDRFAFLEHVFKKPERAKPLLEHDSFKWLR